MKRDEHLHIKKSVLVEVLSVINYDKKTSPIALADKILEASRGKTVGNFYKQFLGVKAKTRQKLQRTMEAEVPNATVSEFNRVLMDFRLSKKSKYSKTAIRLINRDSPDYIMLKEIAKIAQTFVDDFDITDKKEGYFEFLEIGYELMGERFYLNKYKTFQSRIFEIFQSKVDVIMDDQPEATKQLYGYWRDAMIEYAGLDELIDIDRDYKKYAHLVYARRAAEKNKADYEDWVVAQFEGLTFMNAIPELYQFYGEGAEKRYERYLKDTVEIDGGSENSVSNFHRKGKDL